MYEPFRFFSFIAAGFIFCGMLGDLRFLFYYLNEQEDGHIQSLILSSTLIGIGFITFLTALLADLLCVNRRMIEEIRYRVLKQELNSAEAEKNHDRRDWRS